MACIPVHTQSGRFLGFVCIRGRSGAPKHPKCFFCNRKAQALCDHELGGDELALMGQKTCDVAMCDDHRARGAGDTDYCPLHKDEAAQQELFG